MTGGELMRRWTSSAPASRSMRTSALWVVPRTIESSMTTSRLPSMLWRSGFNFMRTARARSSWLGAMKLRPM